MAVQEVKQSTVLRHILPVAGEQYKETAESSGIVLNWHTENLPHPYPPHFLLLLCLRPDPERRAKTLLSHADEVWRVLPVHTRQTLLQQRFGLKVEDSFNFEQDESQLPLPVSVFRWVRTHSTCAARLLADGALFVG